MSIPKVVLASDDLNAQARVLAAASSLEVDVVTVAPSGFIHEVTDAALLIIDLDRGREPALAALAAVGDARPPIVIGFLSHVDADLAAAARAAGCKPMPRGRFWSSLSQLLSSVS